MIKYVAYLGGGHPQKGVWRLGADTIVVGTDSDGQPIPDKQCTVVNCPLCQPRQGDEQ